MGLRRINDRGDCRIHPWAMDGMGAGLPPKLGLYNSDACDALVALEAVNDEAIVIASRLGCGRLTHLQSDDGVLGCGLLPLLTGNVLGGLWPFMGLWGS